MLINPWNAHRLGQLAFVPGVILLGWFLQSHLAVAVVLYTYSSFFFTFPRPGLTTYSVEIASQKSGATRGAGWWEGGVDRDGGAGRGRGRGDD